MTLIVGAAIVIAVLIYVFYRPGRFSVGQAKNRLDYILERKDVLYDNLRDLNFEFRAGKLPLQDYQSLKASMEEEAARLLAEMNDLQHAAAPLRKARR